jgi:hypothetical protein
MITIILESLDILLVGLDIVEHDLIHKFSSICKIPPRRDFLRSPRPKLSGSFELSSYIFPQDICLIQ